MSILDKAKNLFGISVTPSIPVVKICMMGGKGVGKTSVLTSIYKNIDKALGGDDAELYMLPDSNTTTMLNDKFDELKHMFYNSRAVGIPESGISGDLTVNEYSFVFGKKHTDTKFSIEITDFPGEFIERSPDIVKRFINESSVVLIALDTPHLMEAGVDLNDAKNCCTAISDFVESYLEETDDPNKMILFVPLKCEKYYNEKNMKKVADKIIGECYTELCSTFKMDKYKTHIASAVTPILTVGDIVFDDFGRDIDGNISTVAKKDGKLVPAKSVYKFRTLKPEYSPKNCEQPIFYMLSYIARQAEAVKNAPPKSLLEKLKAKFASMFTLLSVDPSFMLSIGRLKRHRITNKPNDGFVTISGQNLF